MTPTRSKRRRPARALLELAVSLAAFVLPVALFGRLDLDRLVLVVAMGGLFWLGAQIQGSPRSDRSMWVIAIERTWAGAGLNLLLVAGLSYGYAVEPGTFELAVTGSILAGIVNGLVAAFLWRKPSGPVLLVGGAPLGANIVGELQQAVIGVVGPAGQVPPGLTFLGDFSGFAGVVAAQRPARIVVSLPGKEASALNGSLNDELLQYRLAGIEVDHVADLYEKVYLRVCTEGLAPADLLTSTAFTASRPIMALQATYSNIMGLTLLVTLFPLLAILSVASRLAAGPGTLLERVECAGFQGIPFYRLRFRTRNSITGQVTWAGKMLEWLGLAGLPQVINIVRGEMAMFGPSPVRKEFADVLERKIPAYARRFSTRPGLLGWARVHMPPGLREAVVELEYDLYYIKECSPSLDFEILLRTLLRRRHVPGRMR